MSVWDLLIRNGTVIDGTGQARRRADVLVKGERIVDVGIFPQAQAHTVIDATDQIVCPGFIDAHTHSDLMLLAQPQHDGKIAQGVTTDVIGHDGLSYAPVTEEALAHLREHLEGLNGNPPLDYDWRSVRSYLERFRRRAAVNVIYLIPHAAVRVSVLGMANRAPTPEELRRMQHLVAQGMEEGGVGLSTALSYAPCSYASTEEMIALCRAIAPYGGVFAPHLRNYGNRFREAFEEAIHIAREAEVALHLTHFQVSFRPNWGQADVYLQRIDEERARGMDITMDCYPYPAGSTFLMGLFPSWVSDGGTEAALQRLSDPATAARIDDDLNAGCDGLHGVPVDWREIVIGGVNTDANRHVVGQSVAQAAAAAGREPFDFVRDLLVAEQLKVSCIVHNGHEGNIEEVVKHPATMAGSDGILVGERPHPRAYGTFARWLSDYARHKQLLPLEELIRKMTSLPAERFGAVDRGVLKPGAVADIVVFHPEGVADRATWEQPRSQAVGVSHVAVNGQLVWTGGEPTGVLPGEPLTPPRHSRSLARS